MSRREFSSAIKRAAWDRADGLCEAVGAPYGLPARRRCNASLLHGVEYDHATADGLGGAPDLDNCLAVCLPCHRIKSRTHDVPKIAKAKRLEDKFVRGIKRAKSRLPTKSDKLAYLAKRERRT